MSIVQEILFILSDYPGGYRTIYDILYGSNKDKYENKKTRLKNTLKSTLNRLKKSGLINYKDNKWTLSIEGKEFLSTKTERLENFYFSKEKPRKSRKKEMILIFDIPEKNRRYRDWLRDELIGFGFEPIQKSVWFGPALPEKFINFLFERKILKYTRFFRVSEKDLI